LNKRSIRTLLVIALVMVGVPVLATTINKSIQPQRHAEARHCFSGDTNRCDMPSLPPIASAAAHRTAMTTRASCNTLSLAKPSPTLPPLR
jgi:hypothetical protein